MRPLSGLALAFLVGCGAAASTEPPSPRIGAGPPATVTGLAHVFGPGGGPVAGAMVAVAEAPEIATTTDEQGAFSLQVPSEGEASFVMRRAGFHDLQTATLPVPRTGLEQISFQAPTDRIFDLLGVLVNLEPDPARCQIATTVSAWGTAPYGGDALGVPGTTVALDPPLPPAHGPIYFRYVGEGLIVPDTSLRETTVDGGVFWVNVPPGEYRLAATLEGKRFTAVKVWCRAGFLVNAAPPWGIQERNRAD